jgi:transposase
VKGKRRRFTAEFKEEAVRLVVDGKRPLARVARELGLHEQLLRKWRNAVQRGAGSGNGTQAGYFTQAEELRRLRAELARVKEERDILKKATAFFARESH